MRKILAAIGILYLLFFISGCSTEKAVANMDNQAYGDKKIVWQKLEEDIYGSGKREKIVFYVYETAEGMPLIWSLEVNGEEVIKLNHDDGFFSQSQIKFDDIDGDNKPEALLYRYSTGSAGAQCLNIYKISPENWFLIFSEDKLNDYTESDNGRFNVEYLGDYQVSFSDNQTGLKVNIPLEKELYKGIENMLEGISTWVDPVSEFEAKDIDGNKKKEIITRQRVIGVAHVDTIALFETIYKLTEGQYKPIRAMLLDIKGNILGEIEISK